MISVSWTDSLPSWAFFSLPTRAWELAVGGLVALTAGAWRHLPGPSAAVVGWGGLALIVVTCTQVGEATPYPGTTALLPVLGTALVIGAGCATPDLGVGHFLSKPAMRSIGRLSYSWYLWHWPVLLLAPCVVRRRHRSGGSAGDGGGVVRARDPDAASRREPGAVRAVVEALGRDAASRWVAHSPRWLCAPVWCCWWCGRFPSGRGRRRRRLRLSRRPRPSAEAPPPPMSVRDQVLAAVAGSVGSAACPNESVTPALGDDRASPRYSSTGACCRGGTSGNPSACRVMPRRRRRWRWWVTRMPRCGSRRSNRLRRERHWRLETMGKVLCPLMDLPINSPYLGRQVHRVRAVARRRHGATGEGTAAVDRARHVAAVRRRLRLHRYDQAWLDSLTRLVQRLRATGASVLVLSQVPDPHSTVPTCRVGAHGRRHRMLAAAGGRR